MVRVRLGCGGEVREAEGKPTPVLRTWSGASGSFGYSQVGGGTRAPPFDRTLLHRLVWSLTMSSALGGVGFGVVPPGRREWRVLLRSSLVPVRKESDGVSRDGSPPGLGTYDTWLPRRFVPGCRVIVCGDWFALFTNGHIDEGLAGYIAGTVSKPSVRLLVLGWLPGKLGWGCSPGTLAVSGLVSLGMIKTLSFGASSVS